MKQTFFRIVELTEHQVLLTKDWDNDNEEAPHVLSITFFLEGVKITQDLCYINEYDRDSVFDAASEDQLQRTVSGMESSLKEEIYND